MAEKKKTEKTRRAPINLFLPDDVLAAVAAAKAKAEASMCVSLSTQKVIEGVLKKHFGLTK
jgi:hypothetical protein